MTMECVRNLRIECPGHDRGDCCLNDESIIFELSEHTRITELIMADVLDGIEHCFGEGGVDAVVGFALARNRSRESDKLMDELEAAFGEPPALPTPGSRLQAAISLWHRFGDSNVEEWEDETHKAEYLDAIDGLASGWLFNILLSRINFDGMDPRTFSLAELQRAIVGAEWPPRIPALVTAEAIK